MKLGILLIIGLGAACVAVNCACNNIVNSWGWDQW